MTSAKPHTDQFYTSSHPDISSPKENEDMEFKLDTFEGEIPLFTFGVKKSKRLDTDNATDLKKYKPLNSGRWTNEECKRFEEALKKFGRRWKKVEAYVGTRSATQIRSHAQKYFLKHKSKTQDGSIAHTVHDTIPNIKEPDIFESANEERSSGSKQLNSNPNQCRYLLEYMKPFGFNTIEDIYTSYTILHDWVNTSTLVMRRVWPAVSKIC